MINNISTKTKLRRIAKRGIFPSGLNIIRVSVKIKGDIEHCRTFGTKGNMLLQNKAQGAVIKRHKIQSFVCQSTFEISLTVKARIWDRHHISTVVRAKVQPHIKFADDGPTVQYLLYCESRWQEHTVSERRPQIL